MDIEIVQNHPNDLGFGIHLIHQPAHAVRKILAGVALGDFDVALARQRFKADVQVTHSRDEGIRNRSALLDRV